MNLKTIEQLLEDIGEDKHQNLATTSFKFKTDMWNFVKTLPGYEKMNAVEFGTHKGSTSRVMAHLFRKVYTINLPKHFDQAMLLNSDLTNIEYIGMDLYNTPVDENFKHDPISFGLVDAGHGCSQVLSDYSRFMEFNLTDGDVYLAFDDYGLPNSREVYSAINQLIYTKMIEKVCYIGHERGHDFGQGRKLIDNEGIICKLIR